jgi:Fe-S oxidoreductase/predicted DNA-binding transcriptional regulator YafY
MGRSMSRASRLQRIEELLLSRPDGYTIQELAERLNIHRTTIWRDLNEISCTAPVQKIGSRYLIDPSDYLSSVRLSSGESLMLYLAMRRIMRRLSHVPPMMTAALEKLALTLRHPSAEQLSEAIQAMQNEPPTDPGRAQIWETLVQAWIERITVRITYQEFDNPEPNVYEVQPYLFEPAVVGEGVHLIGYSLTHEELRAFKVEHIAKAILTTERFARPDNIVVGALLRQVWGIWYGEELTEVRLCFRDPAVASQVRDTIWLPSQKTRDLPNGGVEWSVKVADVLGLVPWIRSWGSACEVLEPRELREYIAEVEHSLGGVTMVTVKTPSLSEAFYDSLLEIADGEQVRLCLQCASCSGICPFGCLMEYPPRRMLAAARAGVFEEVLDTDTVWMCVSCYACTEVCPAKIPLTEGLMTRTKEELLLAGNVPTELQDALEKSQRYGNPLGESPRKRADWTKGIEPEVTIMGKAERPVDVLWFVGDYASYHPRAQLVTKALARVFNALGVDFGILGPEESSDGDSQRLAGERGLFEMLAEKNGQAFSKYKFNKIVTTDPHAYNALKNEYPALGISYPVRHHTQFLAERLDQIKELLRYPVEATVTFHDPCYLGRVNGVYEEPRELIRALPGVGLVEMAHNHENSLCCGGGGGGMWLDGFRWEKAHFRLPEWRVREAVAAHPYPVFTTALPLKPPKHKVRQEAAEQPSSRILAVACPYEAPRFEDATKTVEEARQLVVKDIAELLAEAMDA